MTTRAHVKIAASKLLQRRPLNVVSHRVARLVGPPMLHHMYIAASLMTDSASEAADAVVTGAADCSAEYEVVRDRIAGSAATVASHYPDYYMIEDRTALLLYTLVRRSKPQLVLEIGVADGRATQVILSALDANGSGRLVSADIKSDVGGAAAGHPRWTLRVHSTKVSSSRQVRELVEQVGSPDLFFHDGSHTYYDQYQECLVAWRAMRSGSLLVSDDVDQSFAFLDLARAAGCKPVVLTDRRKATGVLVRP